MSAWLLGYGAALVVIGALDAVWLGWVAKGFYQTQMAAVAADSFRAVPALLFYLGYPAALMALALSPQPASMATAVGRSALVGLLAYGTYDLTNMATLKRWDWPLALADTAWGVVISAAAGAAAYAVLRRSA